MGLISFTETPPLDINASYISPKPLIATSKFFSAYTKFFLSFFAISFTGFSGLILALSIIAVISFLGISLSKEFLNCLFLFSSKSLKTLSSNFFSDKAGFKSIFKIISFFPH